MLRDTNRGIPEPRELRNHARERRWSAGRRGNANKCRGQGLLGSVRVSLGIIIQSKDLRQVGPRGPLELQSVHLRTRQRSLVGQDYPLRKAMQANSGDEAAPNHLGRTRFTRRREHLMVAIEGWLLIASDHLTALPGQKRRTGHGITSIAFRPDWWLRKNQVNAVECRLSG